MADSKKNFAQEEWEKIVQYDKELMDKIKRDGNYDVVSPMTPYGVRFVYRNCLLGFVSYSGSVLLEPCVKYFSDSSDGFITIFDNKGRWREIKFIHV